MHLIHSVCRRRIKIYAFLLDNMTDEHKFQLTTKICQEVVAEAVRTDV